MVTLLALSGARTESRAQSLSVRTGEILAMGPDTSQDPMGHMHMGSEPSGWQFMQDGMVFGAFNRQGGPRGGREFRMPNWWMGMASRDVGRSQLTMTAMLSLDPATVGRQGYREIFQVGEIYQGQPLIDRQHPHDLFMQVAAIWRVAIGGRSGLTVAGAPAGEPALGPVAFMHRSSAAENFLAPLGHHTFDSTHVSFGVATVAFDHGPWVIEGSVFNGREPDDARWDFDFGRMDSLAGRVWFRPNHRWEFQVSTGRLKEPEVLEPGNIQRTTASAAWIRRSGERYTAVTLGYGMNATAHDRRAATFGEITRHNGRYSVYGRAEVIQPETDLLIDRTVMADGTDHGKRSLGAFTLGAVRELFQSRGFEGGLGASLQMYAVPDALRAAYGSHPVSFQTFLRVRLPAGGGRMWNMRMSQPMSGHTTAADRQMP